jgi:hypothetical protein
MMSDDKQSPLNAGRPYQPPIPALKKDQREALGKLLGMRLYSKENIAKWVECDKKLRDSSDEVIVETYDSKGQMHAIRARGPNKQLRYCSYHQAVHPEEEQPASDENFKGMLVRVTDYKPPSEPTKCCGDGGAHEKQAYDGYEHYWMQSEFYNRFMTHVSHYARSATEVKSVVCFGLGRLRVDADDYAGQHAATSFLQHAAAVHIRDVFAKLQKQPRESIPIYAQDPAYCSNCKAHLKTRWNMEIMDFNSGFLKVDANTFVVSLFPAAPVRQIVGDITCFGDVLGPAGMLTQPTGGDGIEAANRVVDMPSPRFYEFVLKAIKNGLRLDMVPEPTDSIDEENDANNMVYQSETVPSTFGMVFVSIGMYFSRRSK